MAVKGVRNDFVLRVVGAGEGEKKSSGGWGGSRDGW